ncbi:restriction endonuclease subunit S [Streptomyces sp. NPDC057428]|uniref:restriction endonuclease subunit S n=1 Tax=Streptomyces sp. NPDC057428 TaxID=3346129 RepID=UPI0036820EF8
MGEWKHATLESLCSEITVGHVGSMAGEYVPKGIPFLRSKNIRPGRIDLSGIVYIGVEFHERLTKSRLRENDVVIVRTGVPGVAALVPAGFGPANCSDMIIARPGNAVDPRFLCYSINVTSGAFVSAHSVGAVQQHFNVGSAKNLKILVPPKLKDQHAVAEVLGALDDKITLNERIRSTALDLASACYESAAKSSQPETIGDLAALFDGPHATPQKTREGAWFLSISSLKSGYLDLAESAHLSEEDFPRWTRRVQPQAGDVLFSYETRLGDAALMPAGIQGSLGRRMALLRSKSDSVSGALLLHAYLASSFQEEIKRRTIHGATVDRLPLKEMPGWRIYLPAAGERARLSAELDALHATVMQTSAENRTLADLRDTLLPQLITGKLRVKDATRVVEEAV